MDERTPLHDFTWTALRIVAGVTIFTGGTAKLFGWFGGFGDAGTAELLSRYGIAGVLETFCGALIIVGLFTRQAAFLLSGMLVFLFFAVWGAGPYSIDARRSGTDLKA